MAALSARLRRGGPLPLLLREAYARKSSTGRAPNLLVQADNLELLHSMRSGPLREYAESFGGLKLAYLDPPFAVGADFYTDAAYGGPRVLAYSDIWPGGLAAYLDMMGERLTLLREVLSPQGCVFLHCDSRVSHHLRLLLDGIFGPERFLGEIIWHYTGGGRARRWFSRKHDSIFHYAVSGNWTFDPDAVRVPYRPGSGYARSGITSARGKRYLPHPLGTPVDDVWDIPMVNPLAAERTGYPTQKPLALLERILAACSRPGDLTADFFCGSGTLAVAASRLGRAWICADQSPLAVQTAKMRLLAMHEPPDFVLAGESGLAGEKASAGGKEASGKGRRAGKGPGAARGGAAARQAGRNEKNGPAGEQNAAGADFFQARTPGGPVRYRLRPRLRFQGREQSPEQASVPEQGSALEQRSNAASQPVPNLDTAFSVLLEALDVEIDGLQPGGVQLPQPGFGWLRSWGLGRAAGPDFATPWFGVDFLSGEAIWQAPDCARRELPLRSPELPCGQEPLIVWLTDIFGNTTSLPLDTKGVI